MSDAQYTTSKIDTVIDAVLDRLIAAAFDNTMPLTDLTTSFKAVCQGIAELNSTPNPDAATNA